MGNILIVAELGANGAIREASYELVAIARGIADSTGRGIKSLVIGSGVGDIASEFASKGGGDTLVVWRLDRLARSLKQLIETVEELDGRGVGFRSLTESIDTTTNGGRLIFHIFGALAEFERSIIRERTTAGLEAARARGRTGGRGSTTQPRCKLNRPDRVENNGVVINDYHRGRG